jgi:dipeptidyl aminopeptidase/acylaminoacyl peptidase
VSADRPVSPFEDLAAFAAMARVTTLAVSSAGRVVAAVEEPDEAVATYVSALWELDPEGQVPARRLTWSGKGESDPVFLADGSLVFVSSRVDDEAALWRLPAGGEACVLARYPGGIRGPVVAVGTGAVLASGSRPVGADDDGALLRAEQKDRKITAIVHTGMPIRYWDHELGDVSPRLLVVADPEGQTRRAPQDGAAPLDLVPDAAFELVNAEYDITADGTLAATTWTERRPRGQNRVCIALVDVVSGTRRLLEPDRDASFRGPRLSPDGRLVAVVSEMQGHFDEPMTVGLRIMATAPNSPVATDIDIGDVFPREWCWSPDGSTLYVSGDWHGRGAVLAVDVAHGRVVRRLAADASYSSLASAANGERLYAIRSAVDSPPTPVHLDPAASDQAPVQLLAPTGFLELPGTLEEVDVGVSEGASARAWLCLPPPGDTPAPVMLWVHGGPFSSWNSWSWRWNPWVAVERGWAVLLPDPALSTGYGPGWWARAWPHRAEPVWQDLEAVLDAALARPDLDASRTACLGGSFGGYITNWVAGHTDRFGAIVTHAGLWALDQQHTTTDIPAWKNGLVGTPEDRPEWFAANSPHHTAARIRTPMLIVHGNRDYRVPFGEAQRLWWDLVSRFEGPPEELPHRFLQFTGENHWISSPANAEIWYETVLGFCAQYVGRSAI